MTNFENLSELKTQLFDAPAEVKTAFNTVCQFFDGKRKPTFEDEIDGTVKQALSVSGKSFQEYENNKVLKSLPKDYVYIDDDGSVHQYLKGHASNTEEGGDYAIYEYNGKKFPVLVNNPGYNPVFGDKAALKAIWEKVHK